MTNIATCPYCLAGIENDSLYCDHCGKELYICPTCKTYGRGKFCRNDGNTLEPARQVLQLPEPVNSQPKQLVSQPEQPKQPANQLSEPVSQPSEPISRLDNPLNRLNETIVHPIQPESQPKGQTVLPTLEPVTLPPIEETTCPTAQPLLVLRCLMEDIVLTLDDGNLIGRRSGDTPQLARYGVVSGRHASVHRLDDQWMITDEGSSNGTWVNDRRLPVGALHPLIPGTTIRIATLDFLVE